MPRSLWWLTPPNFGQLQTNELCKAGGLVSPLFVAAYITIVHPWMLISELPEDIKNDSKPPCHFHGFLHGPSPSSSIAISAAASQLSSWPWLPPPCHIVPYWWPMTNARDSWQMHVDNLAMICNELQRYPTIGDGLPHWTKILIVIYTWFEILHMKNNKLWAMGNRQLSLMKATIQQCAREHPGLLLVKGGHPDLIKLVAIGLAKQRGLPPT